MSLPDKIKAVLQPDTTSTKLVEKTISIPKTSGTDSLVRSDALRIPGTEGAGIIVTAGSSDFKSGDEVFYRTDAWLSGSLAEFAVVPSENLAPKPPSLSWTDAAATPLSSLTAWQGIFEHGTLDPKGLGANAGAAARQHNAKQRVLITGAAGAVGSWAVKFAAAAGAGAVVAVVSGGKAADAKSFGATEIIDYTATSVDKWAKEDPKREVDTILDCVGAHLNKYWVAIKEGGSFLSMVGDPAGAKPEGCTKELTSAKWYLVQPRGSDLARIGALIEENGWKPLIDSVVPFRQFAEAFDKVDSGKTKGKVVITVPE